MPKTEMDALAHEYVRLWAIPYYSTTGSQWVRMYDIRTRLEAFSSSFFTAVRAMGFEAYKRENGP
jgi:hypothetical protein